MKILFHNVKGDELIFSNDFIFLCFQSFIWFYVTFFHVDLIFKNVKKHKYVYHIIWNMKNKQIYMNLDPCEKKKLFDVWHIAYKHVTFSYNTLIKIYNIYEIIHAFH